MNSNADFHYLLRWMDVLKYQIFRLYKTPCFEDTNVLLILINQ